LQRSSSSHNQTEFAGDSGTGQSGTSHRTERSSRHQASWTIPLRERPDFLFDEGQTSQLFNCLPTLISDSPGAALGTVIFLGMHQSHRYQGRALNDRTRLLTQFVPNPASLSAASEASLEMAGAASIEDILSADLTFYDQQFLLLASGQWSYIAPMKMVNELLAIAEQFVQEHHPHPRREASARIMAAAILMVELRDFTRANEEMVKAIALIGVAYPDATMIELAKSVNPKLVEQTVGHNQDRPDTAILTS